MVKTREIDGEALENATNVRAEFIRVETLVDRTSVNEMKTEFQQSTATGALLV
jgi:hypothetical protein